MKSAYKELLARLSSGNEKSFTDIAKKMDCNRSTIWRYLQKLERDGYIAIDRENWKEVTVKAVTVLRRCKA